MATTGRTHGLPHEPPWTMRLPLLVLGVLAFFGGLINLPYKPFNALERFLAPVFPASIDPSISIGTGTKVILSIATTAVAVLGLYLGLTAWRTAEHPALEPAVLRHGWYVDEALAATVSGPLTEGADGLAFEVDAKGIDGLVNGVARLATGSGRQLRKLQTGYIRNYALGIGLGAVVLLCLHRHPGGELSHGFPAPHLPDLPAPRGRRGDGGHPPHACRAGQVHRPALRRRRARAGRGAGGRVQDQRQLPIRLRSLAGSASSASPGTSGWTASPCSWWP